MSKYLRLRGQNVDERLRIPALHVHSHSSFPKSLRPEGERVTPAKSLLPPRPILCRALTSHF